MKVVCAITGLIMYAYYHDCDPLAAKVKKLIYVLKTFN